ncbi:MAG: ZIP family metal transporter [Bacillota bacterium]
METILTTTGIGFAVGVLGTGVGGLSGFLIDNPSKRFLSFILGLSSGLMLAIICFDLLPEAFELSQLWVGIVGVVFGVMMTILTDEVLSSRMGVHDHGEQSFAKTGILLGLGVAMHNFPEGLAIGSGFMATKALGVGISIVIALHNVPEGISMAAPMRIGGISKIRAFLYTVLAGVPMGLGAMVGALLGEISPNLIAFSLAFAGGTMLYITCDELIPKSKDLHYGRTASFGMLIGFVLGVLIAKQF